MRGSQWGWPGSMFEQLSLEWLVTLKYIQEVASMGTPTLAKINTIKSETFLCVSFIYELCRLSSGYIRKICTT